MSTLLKHPLFPVLCSAALFFFLAHKVDWRELVGLLTHQNPFFFMGSCFLHFLSLFLSAHRLSALLSSSLKLFRVTYIGSFLSQALPGSIGGDVYRGYHLKHHGYSWKTITKALILDRLLGLWALCAFGLLALLLHGKAPLTYEIWLYMAGFLGVLLVSYLGNHFPTLLHPLPLSNLLKALFYALLSGGSLLLCAYVLVLGLKLPLSLVQVTCVLPFVFLCAAFPLSFAGWGMREGAMVFALSFFGISEPQALCLSVSLGFAILLSTLPASLLWMKNHAHSYSR